MDTIAVVHEAISKYIIRSEHRGYSGCLKGKKKKCNGGGMVAECVRFDRNEWEARGKCKTLIFVIKKTFKNENPKLYLT